MAETLTPNDESHDPANAWSPSGGTRVSAVEDSDEVVIQGFNNAYTITYSFTDLDPQINTVTDVTVYAYAGSTVEGKGIKAELFIDDVSQGWQQLEPVVQDYGWLVYSISDWNGPWSREQINSAKVKFTAVMDAKEAALGIDEIYMTVDPGIGNVARVAHVLGLI